jgi:hypothetical protein
MKREKHNKWETLSNFRFSDTKTDRNAGDVVSYNAGQLVRFHALDGRAPSG